MKQMHGHALNVSNEINKQVLVLSCYLFVMNSTHHCSFLNIQSMTLTYGFTFSFELQRKKSH